MMALYVVGIVLAYTRKDKHPRTSKLAGIYFGGSLALSIIGSFMALFPVYANTKLGLSLMQVGIAMSLINIVTTIIGFGLGIVLLYAIFGERDTGKNTIIE